MRSIKSVPPTACPDLSGADLEGGQEGQLAYLEAVAPATIPERQTELRRQRVAFCELDSLALVRLWEFYYTCE